MPYNPLDEFGKPSHQENVDEMDDDLVILICTTKQNQEDNKEEQEESIDDLLGDFLAHMNK